MSRRITIEDVARHAGVGKVTVSYVLNGRSKAARISEETQKRVLKVAHELEYRPNAIARMLVTRRTDTLAVVFQSGTFFTAWSGFTSEVMRGISEATVEEGCDLLLHTKHVRDFEEEASALSDGRVDGALILRDEDDPTLLRLAERGFPCVQFFTHNDALDVPWVDCDNVLGGRLATEHLISAGHRKIAMVCGASRSVSSNQRIEGYRAALAAHSIESPAEWLISQWDPTASVDCILKLFKNSNRPTALFVWSDDVALPIMRGLRSGGVRVPEDVSIVGFDSSIAAESCEPPLTSVRQPVREMAAAATHLLIAMVRKQDIPERKILLKPALDIRASTGNLHGRSS